MQSDYTASCSQTDISQTETDITKLLFSESNKQEINLELESSQVIAGHHHNGLLGEIET